MSDPKPVFAANIETLQRDVSRGWELLGWGMRSVLPCGVRDL